MKANTMMRLTASMTGALAVLLQPNLNAQTLDPWQTVEDFQLVAGISSGGIGIGTDATGTHLFSVGSGHIDTAGNGLAVINRSVDSGQTWTTVDLFPPDGMTTATYDSFAADPVSGRLYAGGSTRDSAGNSQWLVRRSDDGGATWPTTEERFQNAPGLRATCLDVKADAAGNIYAGGDAYTTTPGYDVWTVRRRDAVTGTWRTVDALAPGYAHRLAVHPTAGVFVAGHAALSGVVKWTVRRSPNGISSWTTVDSFSLNKYTAAAYAITVGSSGAIYVAGPAISIVKGNVVTYWVVRRSTNGGTTWSTIDAFLYNGGLSATPWAVAVDAAGAIWVGGQAAASSVPGHWLVRKGTTNPSNGTVSWKISDDFLPAPGQASHVADLTTDAAGNVFAIGNASDSTGTAHWIVRRLAAQ